MKPKKLLFILSLLGILLIIFISQASTQQTIQGKIESIDYGNNKITIKLENQNQELIIFENKILSLQIGSEIKAFGKNDIYQGKTQFIVDKIELIS